MTKALTNSQVFLNELTIEASYERYMSRWHLPSVQRTWEKDGKVKRPTLAMFKKRFGKDYEKRQKWLARNGQGSSATAVAVDGREDAIQTLAEQLLSALGGVIPEPEGENLGLDQVDHEVEDDTQASSVLAILSKRGKVTETKTEEPKFVKPENFDELPRSGQVYFFLHRAQEAGLSYAIVPLKRGVAAEAISQIKDDGRPYQSVASALLKAKK